MNSWRLPERVSRWIRVTFRPGTPLTRVQVPVSGAGLSVVVEGGSGALGGGVYFHSPLSLVPTQSELSGLAMSALIVPGSPFTSTYRFSALPTPSNQTSPYFTEATQ